ncbi:MAG: ProP protein [uncultured Gemmatimonadaceae bacterium]|uniref:ProP protein n=1 Tax=uncultured Gemmatimonadaceae bacterium TaxID=246130 RepID=A0A6J4MBX2_9BACT|nr:MAG: ProP protein [uncultured Gemmatimonadaceae bacterium]
MQQSLVTRLRVMMFLEFFAWGAWYATIAVYMANAGMEQLTHWPYTVNPVAAIAAPFFLGFVADRFFPTERVLGVLHLLGGVVMLLVPRAAGAPTLFIGLLLLYNLCFMPTLGLSNSLAFSHITDQEREFPRVRVFGTIGWIAAGLFVSFVLSRFAGRPAEGTALPLYTTAVASLVLGAYSFTLPHTPPQGRGTRATVRGILGLDALKTLGSRPFYVFVLCSFLICIPLAAYYNFTQLYLGTVGVQQIAATQTLGQVSEVGFMLLMPFMFRRLGVKWMILVGMAAWVLRYALFAVGAPGAVVWMVVLGIALHGICYDFFFVTGQIYVDKKSTPAIRAQAQGFLVFITYGVGMLIGAQVAGAAYNRFLQGGAETLSLAQWQQFWWLPAGFALGVLLLFALLFHDRVDRATTVGESAASAPTPAPAT